MSDHTHPPATSAEKPVPPSEGSSLKLYDLDATARQVAIAIVHGYSARKIASTLEIPLDEIKMMLRHPDWLSIVKEVSKDQQITFEDIEPALTALVGPAIQTKADILNDDMVDLKLRDKAADDILRLLKLERPKAPDLVIHVHTKAQIPVLQGTAQEIIEAQVIPTKEDASSENEAQDAPSQV